MEDDVEASGRAAPGDEVAALFALPPEEFTAARNALVKRLRGERRRDEADAVKALRRPTRAAWALNQVARNHPEAVADLVAAGGDLWAAQRRALSGVKDSGLREAAHARREHVERVWSLVASVLRDAGADPGGHRQAVVDTLETASVDSDAAAAVRAGRLTSDLPASSGFGETGALAIVETPPDADAAPSETTSGPTAQEQALAAAREAARHARDRADELQSRAGDARQKALRTRAAAQRLQEQADAARERAEQAEAEADDVAERAAAAAAAADEADHRLREAAAAVDE